MSLWQLIPKFACSSPTTSPSAMDPGGSDIAWRLRNAEQRLARLLAAEERLARLRLVLAVPVAESGIEDDFEWRMNALCSRLRSRSRSPRRAS